MQEEEGFFLENPENPDRLHRKHKEGKAKNEQER